MDEHGYVRLTDLGIARTWKAENSQDTSGTPGYMGKILLLFNKIIENIYNFIKYQQYYIFTKKISTRSDVST